MTVVTPGKVSRPLCGGAKTCDGEQLPHGFAFVGTQIAADTAFTFSVDLPKGSVAGAQPQQADRLPSDSISLASDTHWTVAKDGSMMVVEEHSMLGAKYRDSVIYNLLVRDRFDELTDRLTPVEGFTATWDGLPVSIRKDPPQTDKSLESAWYWLDLPEETGVHRLRISYTVRGAVDTRTGVAKIVWPSSIIRADDRAARRLEVTLPGKAVFADCAEKTLTDPKVLPVGQEGLRGTVVRCLWSGAAMTNHRAVHFEAASVPDALLVLEPGRDHATKVRQQRALTGAPVGVLLACALPWLARVRRRQHLRYADTPPGVVDEKAPEVPDDGRAAPVRFTPPEVDRAEAGALLGARPSRVLASVLARLAAAGLVTVEHPPLVLRKAAGAEAPRDDLEAKVWYACDKPSHQAATTSKKVTGMSTSVSQEMDGYATLHFRRGTTAVPWRRLLVLLGPWSRWSPPSPTSSAIRASTRIRPSS